MTQTHIDEATRGRVSGLRQASREDAERIRNHPDLTPDAKRRAIARSWLTHKTALAELRTKLDAGSARERRDLERRLFGLDTLILGSQRDTALLAARDAHDRVDAAMRTAANSGPRQLGEVDARTTVLTELLERAERSGDEYMARAVAEVALRQGNADILNAFSSTRPHLESDVDRLWAVSSGGAGIREQLGREMEFAVDPPSEVHGLQDSELQALADSPVMTPAAAL